MKSMLMLRFFYFTGSSCKFLGGISLETWSLSVFSSVKIVEVLFHEVETRHIRDGPYGVNPVSGDIREESKRS